MSYAGKESRSYRGSASTSSRLRPVSAARSVERERSNLARGQGRAAAPPSDSDVETDWQHIAIFAAGALLGAALGAGATLLLAPMTGQEVRHGLARRGRRLRSRTADAWGDLRDELQFAARRGRRKIGRALRRRHANREWQEESALDD
jgi:gas vesicle protein